MNIALWIVIAVVVVAILVFGAIAMRRRKETKLDLRRAEAQEQRDLAKVRELEAQRQSAEAEERAARAKREQLAAQQQELAAARSRADVDDLRTRADQVDPDIEPS
jgi:FtsZ-interacting cell division protein ZipA